MLFTGGFFLRTYLSSKVSETSEKTLLEVISLNLGQIDEIDGISFPITIPIGSECVRIYFDLNGTYEHMTICPHNLSEGEIEIVKKFNSYPFQIQTNKWQYTEIQSIDRSEFLKIHFSIRELLEST